MNKLLVDQYLNTLYLKSKNDLRGGYNYKIIAAILGLDKTTSKNIFHYLSNKGFIDTKSGYGNSVLLTASGFDYIDKLRENKTYKIVKFINAQYIPPASKLEFGYSFRYNIIDELGQNEERIIGVFASDLLTMAWQLQLDEKGIKDFEKILLQFAKEEITKKLGDHLDISERINLIIATQPSTCPYKPENLVETKHMEFEVEISKNRSMEGERIEKMAEIIETKDYPCVFISYSWDSDEHKRWVLNLTEHLYKKRVHVILDRYELSAGKNMIHFMESSISKADKVLIIFTPNYKNKADRREGGVGYEYSILNAELYHQIINNNKFIPVLRSGSFSESIPSFIQQFIAVDMTKPDDYEEKLNELIHAIYDRPMIEKPKLGEAPFS